MGISMSDTALPRSIAPETCLDFPVSDPPVVNRPSIPDSMVPECCSEPYVIVFEKLHEPVDQCSLDILTNVFQSSHDVALTAEIGELVQLRKTDFETAGILLERVVEKKQEDQCQGDDHHTLQFAAIPVSKLTRG